MKSGFLLTLLFLAFFNTGAFSGNKIIKVACVGNSITFGAGIKDRPRDSYPSQLQRLLGLEYKVRNYGFSGRTMLLNGDHPYMKERLFKDALEWQPDIVVIMLGTNDSKPHNWKYADEFEADYLKMIESFDTLRSNPEIYVVAPVPVFKDCCKIKDDVVRDEIYPVVKKIAEEKNLHFIDLYNPLKEMGDMFPDGVHPDADGAAEMAKLVYESITGKKGELVPQEYPGLKSKWHGFDKYDFELRRTPAHIMVPKNPQEGKPWVWRARFPNWHYQMDSILLSEGYYIAYINTNNMYGSPEAMRIWDRFYRYLTNVQGFNKKVALEGVSRGGLFVYNWAKKHPELVSCIYAEAPVCDFTSWPGGFGEGIGSKGDWEQLKKEYGFKSDEEAKAYKDMPVDNLDNLAKAKVPVLHMIGLNDKVVPPDENTMVLINRYIKSGGIATVVPCTEGKQELYGHHFEIETPQLGADFIKYNTKLPKQPLKSSDYHELREGLKNSFIKFEKEKKGRVAFLGGSITYNPGWRDSICNYLEKRFPDTEFDFIAAGIPSFGSTENAFRFKRDVLKNGPVDLLFVEAAVNDGGKGRSETEIKRAMEGVVRHARYADPTTDIVFMYFVDPSKIKDYNAGKVPDVIRIHDEVAAYYNLPALNLAKEVTDRINAGEFTWKDDFKNLHPSPFGQGVYARSMLSFLNDAYSGFVAEDDKIENYEMPSAMDKYCYDNGVLIEAKEALLAKGPLGFKFQSGALSDKYEVVVAKGWTYHPVWEPEIKAYTRANFIKVPMLVGEYPAKTLKFLFSGNAVGIAVAAGPDAGIIEYRIDKGEWKTKDLFTRHSKIYHLPWYYVLADALPDGKHTLELRLTNKKNKFSVGNKCVLRYFFVNETVK
ncbi:MAG: prolyl oligopeptidase family serine peptidase [Chlorobi bacterium]|nr:prolyl oligopeptidase family serine peptidase [Chlorobiota bacterium]